MFNSSILLNPASIHIADFESALSRCNPQQLEAINHIEGPVLVIAGPGTGKTQILSLRIGKILLDTHASAHNILCLTYTDAGTIAMRKRLLELIGPDAYRVHIHTFHSFCNTIIQENRRYFGGITELSAISELETIDVFYKLIDNFDVNNRLKKFTGDVYFNQTRLKSLFDTIKKENLDTAFLILKADEHIAGLLSNPDYQYKKANAKQNIKAGDPNMRLIQPEIDKMEDFKAAVAEFDNFQKLMAENKRYDFNDMIDWVISAFKTHDDLLAKYQEKYLYFLVDEFQDTNGSQIEILNQLTNFWEAPNLFAVGDDDQSIYSFQGAENERVKEFVEKYKSELYPVVLTSNYRSTQTILDLSKSVIENNRSRLIYDSNLKDIFAGQRRDLNKNLKAEKQKPDRDEETKTGVRIIEYYNSFHETGDIVKQIEELMAKGENLSETAIIYRSHKHIADIIKVFDHKKIPYNAKLKLDILTLGFVRKLLSILRYLHEENRFIDSGEYLLFEIMHFDFFNISTQDLAVLARECSKNRLPWRKAIADKQFMFRLGLISAKAISELEDKLSYWQKEKYNVTLQVLFEKIISKGGIVSFVMNSEDKIWLLQVLTAFFNFIKDESVKNPRLSLKSFLDMVDKMSKNKIPVELNKIVYAQNGVNLVTAHSSKGLEFKNVFLINCTADTWEDKRAPSNSFKFPPLVKELVSKEDEENRHLEEERRLFYVAMTRAKENLFISYPAMKISDADPEKATLVKSRFVAEILEKNEIPVEKIHLENEDLAQFTMLILLESVQPEIQLMEKNYLTDVLKNYRLSVTHLSKYLKCKLSFYFENILQVPTARSASMGFGTAVHDALDELFKGLKTNNNAFVPLDTFLKYFDKSMLAHASHFTEEEFARRTEYSRVLLPALYNEYIDKWNRVVVTEYAINNAEADGIPVKGKLDKLEFDGKEVNVVDYKTGKIESAQTKIKLRPPDPDADPEKDTFEAVYGGDYWRQIVFYKILMDNDKTQDWKMVSGEIDFVESTKKGEFVKQKFYPVFEEMAFVKAQIRKTYNGIMAHDFYQGCGKEDCHWCNFVKENYKGDLIEMEEE